MLYEEAVEELAMVSMPGVSRYTWMYQAVVSRERFRYRHPEAILPSSVACDALGKGTKVGHIAAPVRSLRYTEKLRRYDAIIGRRFIGLQLDH
jgi:hypothetical protein